MSTAEKRFTHQGKAEEWFRIKASRRMVSYQGKRKNGFALRQAENGFVSRQAEEWFRIRARL
jgi:hypothetical protein